MLDKKFDMDDLPNDIMRQIYQYWLDKKGDCLMPSRADLKPEEMAKLLPYLTLVDVEVETGRYRFRLIGTETVKIFGQDVTGAYLDEMPGAESYLKTRYDWLVKEKRPYYVVDSTLKWSKKASANYYVLGLPLSGDGEEVDMFLFGTYYHFPHELRTEFYDLGHKDIV